MSDKVIVTGIATIDLSTIELPKRGAVPQRIDPVVIQQAITGRDAGEYISAENAAYQLANDRFNNDRDADGYEAYRKQLSRRLKQYF